MSIPQFFEGSELNQITRLSGTPTGHLGKFFSARSLIIIDVINTSKKPIRNTKIQHSEALLFGIEEQYQCSSGPSAISVFTSDRVRRIESTELTIDVLAPNEKKRLYILSSRRSFSSYSIYDGIRIFYSDGSYEVRFYEQEGEISRFVKSYILGFVILFIVFASGFFVFLMAAISALFNYFEKKRRQKLNEEMKQREGSL